MSEHAEEERNNSMIRALSNKEVGFLFTYCEKLDTKHFTSFLGFIISSNMITGRRAYKRPTNKELI